MSNKKEAVFKKTIKDCMENDKWDQEMISRVLIQRKKTVRKRSLVSGLIAASVMAAVTIWFIQSTNYQHDFDKMIITQLNGTYKNVFEKSNGEVAPGTLLNEINFDNDIDTLIEDSLNVRY